MDKALSDFKTNFRKKAPASRDELSTVEYILHTKLPADLEDWYLYSNGGAGGVGNFAFLQFWPIHNLIDRNSDIEISKKIPSSIIFGSDGGEEMYGVTVIADEVRYFEVPNEDMEIDNLKYIGNSFKEFINYLSNWNPTN